MRTIKLFNNLKLQIKNNNYENYLSNSQLKLFEYIVSKDLYEHYIFNIKEISNDYNINYIGNTFFYKKLKSDLESLCLKKFNLLSYEYKHNGVNKFLNIECSTLLKKINNNYEVNKKLISLLKEKIRFTIIDVEIFKLSEKSYIIYRYLADMITNTFVKNHNKSKKLQITNYTGMKEIPLLSIIEHLNDKNTIKVSKKRFFINLKKYLDEIIKIKENIISYKLILNKEFVDFEKICDTYNFNISNLKIQFEIVKFKKIEETINNECEYDYERGNEIEY